MIAKLWRLPSSWATDTTLQSRYPDGIFVTKIGAALSSACSDTGAQKATAPASTAPATNRKTIRLDREFIVALLCVVAHGVERTGPGFWVRVALLGSHLASQGTFSRTVDAERCQSDASNCALFVASLRGIGRSLRSVAGTKGRFCTRPCPLDGGVSGCRPKIPPTAPTLRPRCSALLRGSYIQAPDSRPPPGSADRADCRNTPWPRARSAAGRSQPHSAENSRDRA